MGEVSTIDDIATPISAEVIAAFHTHGIIMRRGKGETIALVLQRAINAAKGLLLDSTAGTALIKRL